MSASDRKPQLSGARRPSAAAAKPMPPIARRPPLSSLAIGADPLDPSTYPEDIEGSTKAELGQLEEGFRARLKADMARKASATDGGYYFVVAFESSGQATAMLRALGLPEVLFQDGRALADRLKIEIPPADIPYNPGGKASPRLAALVRRPGK